MNEPRSSSDPRPIDHKYTTEDIPGIVALSKSTPTNDPSKQLSPSEAVLCFAAWLTTRPEAVTFGETHNASRAAELVQEFNLSQDFAVPRDNFTDYAKAYPKDAK